MKMLLATSAVALAFGAGAAEWITVPDAPRKDWKIEPAKQPDGELSAPGTSRFLATFRPKGEIVGATWKVTGLGVFNVFINGASVGDDFLKPGFTHAIKCRHSFSYDVSRLLVSGRDNRLEAEVSSGWWRDKISLAHYLPDWAHVNDRPSAFYGELEVFYKDGTKEVFETDTEHWTCAIAGPVVRAGIYDGEIYDARQEKIDYSVFGKPGVTDVFKGEIRPIPGAQVTLRRDLTLKPVEAYAWKGVTGASDKVFGTVVKTRTFGADEAITLSPGETLMLDFGQNCSAVPEFVFGAKEGTVVTALFGEMVNDGNGERSRGNDGPAGSLYRENLRIPWNGMRVEYTFAAGHEAPATCWHPQYTFFGYRYMSVTATDTVTIAKVVSVPVTSVTKEMERGEVRTGVKDVNRLVDNCYWGMLSNYLSVPTDCPQRNERLGWMADTQVFTATALYFADVSKFHQKFTEDILDSQTEDGAFPDVAPFAQYGNDGRRLGWGDAGVIVPYRVWTMTGEKGPMEKAWDGMVRWMKVVADTKYKLTPKYSFSYADWVGFEELPHPTNHWANGSFGIALGHPEESVCYADFLGGCYWIMDAEMMSEMGAALGKADEAVRFAAMAKEARDYVRDEFLAADGQLKGLMRGLQGATLFALRCGVYRDAAATAAAKTKLREIFGRTGDTLQVGFLGTSILLPTLSDAGMDDLAYTLLLQHRFPSWLYSVDQGATTIWERWNSYTKEKGFGPVSMNSFNHYAYGCVSEWLFAYAAGIRPDPKAPGFRHFILDPRLDARLGSAEAKLRTPYGVIESSWTFRDGKPQWTYTIPPGTTATVHHLDGTVDEVGAKTCHERVMR